MAAKYPGCAVFPDADEMLSKAKPEMVVIATPNKLHCPQTLAAVAAGARGIYCEKPMAVNYGDAKEIGRNLPRTGRGFGGQPPAHASYRCFKPCAR